MTENKEKDRKAGQDVNKRLVDRRKKWMRNTEEEEVERIRNGVERGKMNKRLRQDGEKMGKMRNSGERKYE